MQRPRPPPQHHKILEAGGTDLEIFTAIAREMLVRNARDTELTRLLWFTALESHTLSQRFFRTFIAVYYEELAAYIRRRVREGAFRNVDPLLSARGFLGMVVYHFLIQELFGAKKFQKFDPETVRIHDGGNLAERNAERRCPREFKRRDSYKLERPQRKSCSRRKKIQQ